MYHPHKYVTQIPEPQNLDAFSSFNQYYMMHTFIIEATGHQRWSVKLGQSRKYVDLTEIAPL